MDLSINTTKTYNIKKKVVDEKLKQELLVKLLNLMNIKCDTIEEALGTIIEQNELKYFELDKKCFQYVEELKKFYKSNMLNCLHKNSLSKQRFPAVNMLRQILKCNDIKLRPFNVCQGYNKSTGNKIVKRFYKIMTMKDYNEEKMKEEIELKKSIEKKKQLAELNKLNKVAELNNYQEAKNKLDSLESL